jgi:Family of unknown function (DUF5999)
VRHGGVTLVEAFRELLGNGGKCNGVIEFDDGGELLPDVRAVSPDRRGLSHPAAIAA